MQLIDLVFPYLFELFSVVLTLNKNSSKNSLFAEDPTFQLKNDN